MKFEDVMCALVSKPLRDMTDDELREHQISLRSIQTDIPDTPHRRKQRNSKVAMSNMLADIAAKLGKTPEEIMQMPEIQALLGDTDVEETH